MRILTLSNYFYPETVGAGIWVHQLACELHDRGHQVTVLTSFPSYPEGRIHTAYQGRYHLREHVAAIDVIRTYTYATPSGKAWPRLLSFGTFSLSSITGGLAEMPRADVIYAVLPPLPLGVSGWILAKACGARLVLNIQDIHPDIAVAAGFLKNRRAIRFFQAMERWIYRKADRVVVISDGFRQNLLRKGVPTSKIEVVPNWADPETIRPGPQHNSFRRELGIDGEFLVLYSGGLGHNSNLSPVLEAAKLLSGEGFKFVIVGDGVQKEALLHKAATLGLQNTRFLPFQPLERYPEVLASADATLVTLDSVATCASVPSKVYKQMAAARPIVAITDSGSELERLIAVSQCGFAVPPADFVGLANLLRRAAACREEFAAMGVRGRRYLEKECSRSRCTQAIERALRSCAADLPGVVR